MSFERVVLPNGLCVISEDVPDVRSVAAGVWVKTGSRDESSLQHGMTHFLEHLMFKGTGKRSAREIAEQIDAVGGELNAFTAKEYTCFYARVLSDHFSMALELLSDMICHSRFDPDDLEREKSVVLEEIKLYEDTPDELIHDLCAQAVLGNHPLGRPVLGTLETVGALKRADVVDFWRRHYTPDNLIISVVGQLSHDTIHEEVGRFFGGMSGARRDESTAAPLEGGTNLLRHKSTEQIHVCLGAHGLPRKSKERFALQVLDVLLGGSVSSRLFQELREERGLVYSAFSSHAAYRDAGLFSVYLGVSAENLPTVLQLVRREFDAVRRGQIRPEEVERAKEQLRGSILMGLESTSSRMSRLAKSEMFFGELMPVDELIGRIQAVTCDEVTAVARRLLADRPYVAAIGPLGGLEAEWSSFVKEW